MPRKKICLIYTGGTLGMVPSDRGYVPSTELDRLMAAKMPELGTEAMPDFELRRYDPPIDSANAAPEHWYVLAEMIAGLEAGVDGVVVIHGTDTLAYSASALSFLLAECEKPVILTGAQIPLHEVRNDAHGNLLSAMLLAALGQATEVCVCFGPRLLRGNRTTKVRSTALDAFDSPDHPPLADLGTEIRFRDATLPPRPAWLVRPDYRDIDIAVLPIFPGVKPGLLESVLASGVRGLVLESYGAGTAPDRDRALMRAIRDAVDAGIVVVSVSQCLEGRVSLGTYAAGQALADAGVIGGHDMTREAAFTKLHCLTALGFDSDTVRLRLRRNLRGELTP